MSLTKLLFIWYYQPRLKSIHCLHRRLWDNQNHHSLDLSNGCTAFKDDTINPYIQSQLNRPPLHLITSPLPSSSLSSRFYYRHFRLGGFHRFIAHLCSKLRNTPARMMAASQISLYQLKLGRCTRTVVTSLLRFWESRNMMKTGELMGVDMLLLDDQVFGSLNDYCVFCYVDYVSIVLFFITNLLFLQSSLIQANHRSTS